RENLWPLGQVCRTRRRAERVSRSRLLEARRLSGGLTGQTREDREQLIAGALVVHPGAAVLVVGEVPTTLPACEPDLARGSLGIHHAARAVAEGDLDGIARGVHVGVVRIDVFVSVQNAPESRVGQVSEALLVHGA